MHMRWLRESYKVWGQFKGGCLEAWWVDMYNSQQTPSQTARLRTVISVSFRQSSLSKLGSIYHPFPVKHTRKLSFSNCSLRCTYSEVHTSLRRTVESGLDMANKLSLFILISFSQPARSLHPQKLSSPHIPVKCSDCRKTDFMYICAFFNITKYEHMISDFTAAIYETQSQNVTLYVTT